MGLTLGATLLKSFELDATKAVTKLRDCSGNR